jgi:hypothetical protein
MNTIGKMKRPAAGYVNDKDVANIEQLIKNLRMYMVFDMELMETC